MRNLARSLIRYRKKKTRSWRLALLLGTLLLPSLPLSAQNDEALPALVQVLAQTDEPQFQLDVLKGMTEGLKGRREVKMPAGWEELSAKLSKSPNEQIRELAQTLSLTFGSSSALAALRQLVLDSKADPAARKNALASLLQTKDTALAPALQQLLRDPVVRSPALRGLANYDDPKIPGAILSIYNSFGAAEKKDALNTLVSRVAFARPLLATVAAKTIPARDLTADIVRQLRNFKDKDINDQVEKFWGVARESAADKLAEIAKYKAMLQAKGLGDAPRGRAVFSRICQQCHTLFDTGGKVGPDITGSNRSDLDYVLQNVIDPNAVIPNDYRTSTLETKDDRIITGIVTRHDDNAVTIVVPGEEIVVPRNEIKSLTQGEVSMMPEGLFQAMTDDEVRDLVAYLKSPSQVPLPGTEAKVGQ
jgi:putative heme-binding domain-containing protein